MYPGLPDNWIYRLSSQKCQSPWKKQIGKCHTKTAVGVSMLIGIAQRKIQIKKKKIVATKLLLSGRSDGKMMGYFPLVFRNMYNLVTSTGKKPTKTACRKFFVYDSHWTYFQAALLPECVHVELFLRMVELDPVGAGDWLDGSAGHQLPFGLYWSGRNLASCKWYLGP